MSIEDRLASLERKLRRLQLVALFLAGFLVAIVAAAAAPKKDSTDVLKTRHLVVLDENGIPAAEIQGRMVAIMAADGRRRLATLGASTNDSLPHASLSLNCGPDSHHIHLYSTPTFCRLNFQDERGEQLIISTTDQGAPTLDLCSTVGRERSEQFSKRLQSGTASKAELDNHLARKLLLSLGGTEVGGILDVYNMRGKSVATIQAGKTNCGYVGVSDFDGRTTAALSGDK